MDPTRVQQVEAETNRIFVSTGAWHAGAKELELLAKALAADIDALTAENAELKYWKQGNIRCASQLAAANATLDRLREVVPEVLPPHMSWRDALDGARAILYPKNESACVMTESEVRHYQNHLQDRAEIEGRD